MSSPAIISPILNQPASKAAQTEESSAPLRSTQIRAGKIKSVSSPIHFTAQGALDEGSYRQAELFYLQKQIQAQTPMVIVLEDGERVEGCIEWYDRISVKVRGRSRTLVYKSAIKYMYKLGEQGQ
jgi:sRNA-binding regulator protein Hfq